MFGIIICSHADLCKGLKSSVEMIVGKQELLVALPFYEDTPQALIERVRPDVLVKGMDWKGKEVAGSEYVRSYGGRIEFIELEQGLSTTSIVHKIKCSVD